MSNDEFFGDSRPVPCFDQAPFRDYTRPRPLTKPDPNPRLDQAPFRLGFSVALFRTRQAPFRMEMLNDKFFLIQGSFLD